MELSENKEANTRKLGRIHDSTMAYVTMVWQINHKIDELLIHPVRHMQPMEEGKQTWRTPKSGAEGTSPNT